MYSELFRFFKLRRRTNRAGLYSRSKLWCWDDYGDGFEWRFFNSRTRFLDCLIQQRRKRVGG